MQPIPAADGRRWERQPVGIPVRLVLKTDKTRPDSFAATLNFSCPG